MDVPSNSESPTGTEQLTNVNIHAAESVTNGTSSDSPVSAAASASTSGTSSPPPPPVHGSDGSATPTPTPGPVPSSSDEAVNKRASLSRSGPKYTRKPGLGSVSSFPSSVTSGEISTSSSRNSVIENEPQRVTLEDKPMDDD